MYMRVCFQDFWILIDFLPLPCFFIDYIHIKNSETAGVFYNVFNMPTTHTNMCICTSGCTHL